MGKPVPVPLSTFWLASPRPGSRPSKTSLPWSLREAKQDGDVESLALRGTRLRIDLHAANLSIRVDPRHGKAGAGSALDVLAGFPQTWQQAFEDQFALVLARSEAGRGRRKPCPAWDPLADRSARGESFHPGRPTPWESRCRFRSRRSGWLPPDLAAGLRRPVCPGPC